MYKRQLESIGALLERTDAPLATGSRDTGLADELESAAQVVNRAAGGASGRTETRIETLGGLLRDLEERLR